MVVIWWLMLFRDRIEVINCDEFTFVASVWVHSPASLNQVLSSNINGISWTNSFEAETFCFWNEKSPSKFFTFSNIDLRIILVASDMIMASSVIDFFKALNNAHPFSLTRERLRIFDFLYSSNPGILIEWHARYL